MVVDARQQKVDPNYHTGPRSPKAALVGCELALGKDSSGCFEAELSSYRKGGRILGPVVGAFGEMDIVYVIAKEVAEELATEHCGFYSDKKQSVVAAFFLSQIYWPRGLVAHRG